MKIHQVVVVFGKGTYLDFGDVGSCYRRTFHVLYVMLKVLETFDVADAHYILKGLKNREKFGSYEMCFCVSDENQFFMKRRGI